MQKTVNFTGIEDFLNHDACATESMGPIFDRSREHLGVSDKAVIAVRKFLLSSVEALQEGREPPHIVREARRNWFPHIDCFAYLLPQAIHWRQHFDYLTISAEKENPAAFACRSRPNSSMRKENQHETQDTTERQTDASRRQACRKRAQNRRANPGVGDRRHLGPRGRAPAPG